MKPEFPLLTEYLTGYWHQEFDIYGGSIEEITDVYVADTRGADASGLITEIETLLARPDDASIRELAFGQSFVAVRPEGWGLTARQWLGVVRDHLRTIVALQQPVSGGTLGSKAS